MFLDGISAVVLTMAIIEPMIRQAGFDMIWFGIFLVIVVEMAQITPPVGFNLFVLQGMANKDMGYCEICADILGLEVSPNVIAPKNEEQEEDIDAAI